MKLCVLLVLTEPKMSHPARGGWIEITMCATTTANYTSHPARGGWIEIGRQSWQTPLQLSHPARGGWIEIAREASAYHGAEVPPRTGWVD